MVSVINSQLNRHLCHGLPFYHAGSDKRVGKGEEEIFKILYQKIVNEVGHNPIRVSKQNVDEGMGGNLQVSN